MATWTPAPVPCEASLPSATLPRNPRLEAKGAPASPPLQVAFVVRL